MNVLITGASKGIGRATALEIAPDCTVMVLVARTRRLLESLSQEILQINPECNVIIQVIDITEKSSVQECFKNLEYLDVLINCAGKALPPKSVQEITLEVWNEIFSINVASIFLMTKIAIPFLRKSSHPVIVNIASTAGITPRPGWSAYGASKASVVNFSLTMAEELKPYGIKVYCIAPGRTATELRRILAPEEDPKTIMQPEEVARIIGFLISGKGDCLQGQTIILRGN